MQMTNQPESTLSPPGLDPEVLAMAEIERILTDLDSLEDRPNNDRKPSVRVLAYLAEKHRIIGSPGRPSRAQGAKK